MEISHSDKPLSLKRVFLSNSDISILESDNFHFGNVLTIKDGALGVGLRSHYYHSLQLSPLSALWRMGS
jgi:hypothetical protein